MMQRARGALALVLEALLRLGRQEQVVLMALLLLVVGIWAFVELADEVLEGEPHAVDTWAVAALRNPENPALPRGPRWLIEAGRDITALGSTAVLTLVTVAVAGYLALRRKTGMLYLVITAVGVGALLTYLLKLIIDRERPVYDTELLWVDTKSFPSGHSMLAAVVYLSLGELLTRVESRRLIKVYILGIAVTVTILVGLSRIYLGVHYPTDVLAGWAAGLVWAILCWLAARYLQRTGQVESAGAEGAIEEANLADPSK